MPTSHSKKAPQEQLPKGGRSAAPDSSRPPRHRDASEVVIAIMGATGSGKSTFVNLVSGSELGIGAGLESCTSVVQGGKPFDLDGHRVILIDTPGFDDTNMSDVDILNMIALFLSTSYKLGKKLAGVLYFHRISDVRMSGTPRRNFNMFRELCGEDALKNVIIVTNMWEGIDPQVGAARETELMTKGIFFKPVLDKGGQMARHDNTISSAQDILRRILQNTPVPLRIQEELVNEGKGINQTGAGKELDRELTEQIRKHEEEMRELKEEMEQAMEDKDEEMRQELEVEVKRRQEEAKVLQNDIDRMASDFQRQREGVEARIIEVQEEARREAARIAAQCRGEIEELEEAMRTNAAASEEEKARMSQQIEQLNRQLSESRDRGPNPLLDIVTHAVLLAVSPTAFAMSIGGRVVGRLLSALF